MGHSGIGVTSTEHDVLSPVGQHHVPRMPHGTERPLGSEIQRHRDAATAEGGNSQRSVFAARAEGDHLQGRHAPYGNQPVVSGETNCPFRCPAAYNPVT